MNNYLADHNCIILTVNVFLSQILQERETLPVKNFEREILNAVHQSSVVIIRGATGCGKTTQVPQYILDECIHGGRAAECNIVVTQVKNLFKPIFPVSLLFNINGIEVTF